MTYKPAQWFEGRSILNEFLTVKVACGADNKAILVLCNLSFRFETSYMVLFD